MIGWHKTAKPPEGCSSTDTPFFCVTKPIDPGLQTTLETDIIPRQRAHFAAHTLAPEENHPAAARHEQKKGTALSALEATTRELDTLKTQRKTTPKHIQLKDLPPDQRIHQLRGLMHTTINLRPDLARKELRIELHGQANPIHDEAVAAL